MDTNSIQTNRPQKVQNAVSILYVTLGIGIISAILQVLAHGAISRMFTTLVIVAAMAFLIVMTGRGRNWARVTLLILFLVGVLPSILPLVRFFAVHPISGFLGLAQLVLQIVALIFLFQEESSQWFSATQQT